MLDHGPEIIVPLPERIEPARHIRSTLLMSSYASIRDAGYDEAYRAALPKEHHEVILGGLVAGMWVPIEIAVAHYDACATLGMSHDAQLALGRVAGEKIQNTILGTAVRMAREVGVTPLTIMPQVPRFWSRGFDGGGIYIEKRGPKEVCLEVHRSPQADCVYWRAALSGLAVGLFELFCRKAYMNETTKKRVPGFASFRVQWA